MKQKELKNIAKKIAKAELILESTGDSNERAKAEQEIMDLSNMLAREGLEAMDIVDEMV